MTLSNALARLASTANTAINRITAIVGHVLNKDENKKITFRKIRGRGRVFYLSEGTTEYMMILCRGENSTWISEKDSKHYYKIVKPDLDTFYSLKAVATAIAYEGIGTYTQLLQACISMVRHVKSTGYYNAYDVRHIWRELSQVWKSLWEKKSK
jgi:hypothetical protein